VRTQHHTQQQQQQQQQQRTEQNTNRIHNGVTVLGMCTTHNIKHNNKLNTHTHTQHHNTTMVSYCITCR
jgi:hypothetical protein